MARTIDELLKLEDLSGLEDSEVQALVTYSYQRGRNAGETSELARQQAETHEKLLELATQSAERAAATFERVCAYRPEYKEVTP